MDKINSHIKTLSDLKTSAPEKIKALTPKKKILGILAFVAVALAIPVSMVLVNEQQDLRQRASSPTIAKLVFNPSGFAIKNEQFKNLSVLAYTAGNEPIFDGVTYQWGISSTTSIGTLNSVSGSIATFGSKNFGYGDIYVTAANDAGGITQSIPVYVTLDGNKPSPTPTQIPTPTYEPTPAPTTLPIVTPTKFPTSIPSLYPTTPVDAFKGEYFSNANLSGKVYTTQYDNAINFNWGSKSPMKGLPNDKFSVRWTKDQTFQAGTYTFSVKHDDGMRVYIDNKKYYDKWNKSDSGKFIVKLSEGKHSLRIEYNENKGSSLAQFSFVKIFSR